MGKHGKILEKMGIQEKFTMEVCADISIGYFLEVTG
jgi:hypothetical protein